MKYLHFYIFVLLALLVPLRAFDAPSQLLNPGFEEDADNVGYPDGWTVSSDAKVTLTRENPANGSRALVIEDGYAAVHQNLNIEDLANKNVSLTVAARSSDGATLGVRYGYFVADETTGKKWVDAPALWDRQLAPEFQTFTNTRVLPDNALGGRFWICIYRSNRQGTLTVDDVSLEFVNPQSSLSSKQTVVAIREANYLREKLGVARNLKPQNAAWPKIQQGIDALFSSEGQETSFEAILDKIHNLNTEILATLYPNKTFLAAFSEPYQRMEPGRLPDGNSLKWNVVALRGETAALSVEVANPTEKLQTLTLNLGNLAGAEVTMRRQVFMETWYTKGETVVADPLTLLPKEGGKWSIALQPGEITRVHISLNIAKQAQAGKQQAKLLVEGGKASETLPFEMEILPAELPTTPQLAHYQFLYINMNVANDLPAETSQDLEAHGVTDIEWAFMPRATFSTEGKLLDADLSAHDRWLLGFANSPIRLNIFWEGSYKKMATADGGLLEFGSKEWKNGVIELLSAYLDRAKTLGLPRERFTILPMDEVHSAHLDKAPDEEPFLFRDLAQGIKSAEKKLSIYLTIGNYAFPQDVEVVLPTLDVAMPHWPMPEKLGRRNAPPDYNPRKAFFEKTLPMLEAARNERGLKIWSYHVLSGKSDDVLRMSRAYPLLAVAAGYTGFGYWAYNVTSGSSWDDQDGRILDYSLIYDGRETHPLNAKYNVTNEVIVPSIHWEAIRAGQQDGQILLHLQHRLKEPEYPSQLRADIEELLKIARELGGKEGYGSDSLSFADVREFAVQLRHVYCKTLETKI